MSKIRMSEYCKHGWIDTRCYECLKDEMWQKVRSLESENARLKQALNKIIEIDPYIGDPLDRIIDAKYIAVEAVSGDK